jgi:anti-sigma regulatory factor (Ser/Thr protein kinase)
MTEAVVVTLHNRLSELERLSEAVTSFGEGHHLPEKTLYALNLALDEIVTNIISYGYDDQADHQINLRLSVGDGEVTAEVEDDGKPFNPLEAPEPDVTKPIEERQVGGLGIHLTRKLMDRLEYERRQGKNRLLLWKRVTE